MFWEEDKQTSSEFKIPDEIQDVIFKVNCKTLPLDHAHDLKTALHTVFPWFNEEEIVGIHQIHGAESGNGWLRPEDTENELLHLSRRARMSLRVPKERIDEVLALTGQILDIGGYRLEVGSGNIKQLSPLGTQFARYIVVEHGEEDEEAFLQRVADELKDLLNIKIRKVMCGKPHKIRLPNECLSTRSLMVADLEPDSAIKLQQLGLGRGRKLGCGLFLPHKGIKPVGDMSEKSHFAGN